MDLPSNHAGYAGVLRVSTYFIPQNMFFTKMPSLLAGDGFLLGLMNSTTE